MRTDTLAIPTDWTRDGDIWRKAVALVILGDALPEIARVVVVEIPGDMDPALVKVSTLRLDK